MLEFVSYIALISVSTWESCVTVDSSHIHIVDHVPAAWFVLFFADLVDHWP